MSLTEIKNYFTYGNLKPCTTKIYQDIDIADSD